MKKIFVILVALIGFGISVNAQEQAAQKQTNDLLAFTEEAPSTSVVDILIEANDVAYELCNYFNGSWVDVGLKIYCSFGGDVYTCTAYKITKGLCAINGAIKLSIEGNYDAGLRSLLSGATDIFVASRAGSNAYRLAKSGMSYR